MKRQFSNEVSNTQSPEPKRMLSLSFAAKLNAKTMRQLQKAYETDPEVDLTTVIPTNYSSRLASRKVGKGRKPIFHFIFASPQPTDLCQRTMMQWCHPRIRARQNRMDSCLYPFLQVQPRLFILCQPLSNPYLTFAPMR